MSLSSTPWRTALCTLLPALACGIAGATPFELAVSPSRFELAARSGTRLGQAIELQNLAALATDVAVRTIDWTYTPEGDIGYRDDLLPGSCRPWVTLERPTLTLPARGKRTFRFQVDVPADAPRGECRFMVAIEGVSPAQHSVIRSGGTSLSLPVTGRIAIAVYVQLNGAAPQLELRELSSRDVNGRRTGFVTVRNTGDAHGRLEGSLDATDSQGRSYELAPDGSPVMPGQTRTLALQPQADGNAPLPAYSFPVRVGGMLDWDRGSFKIEAELP